MMVGKASGGGKPSSAPQSSLLTRELSEQPQNHLPLSPSPSFASRKTATLTSTRKIDLRAVMQSVPYTNSNTAANNQTTTTTTSSSSREEDGYCSSSSSTSPFPAPVESDECHLMDEDLSRCFTTEGAGKSSDDNDNYLKKKKQQPPIHAAMHTTHENGVRIVNTPPLGLGNGENSNGLLPPNMATDPWNSNDNSDDPAAAATIGNSVNTNHSLMTTESSYNSGTSSPMAKPSSVVWYSAVGSLERRPVTKDNDRRRRNSSNKTNNSNQPYSGYYNHATTHNVLLPKALPQLLPTPVAPASAVPQKATSSAAIPDRDANDKQTDEGNEKTEKIAVPNSDSPTQKQAGESVAKTESQSKKSTPPSSTPTTRNTSGRKNPPSKNANEVGKEEDPSSKAETGKKSHRHRRRRRRPERFVPIREAYTPSQDRVLGLEQKGLSNHPPQVGKRSIHTAAAAELGTLERPNYRDALRRVSMILAQHIQKIELRFANHRSNSSSAAYPAKKASHGNGNGTHHKGAGQHHHHSHAKSSHHERDKLFAYAMKEEFAEDLYSTPKYKCSMVRLPMARPGMVYGMKKIERRYEIPTVEEIFAFGCQLFDAANLAAECPIVGLIYVERLMELSKVPLLATTWRPIFMGGLLLASKVWQDLSSWNIEFASAYPQYSVDAIGRLEVTFLRCLQWKLYISPSEYAKYYFALRSLMEKSDFRHRYHRLVLDSDPAGGPERNPPVAKTIADRTEAMQFSRSCIC